MDNREKAVQMANEMKDHLQNGIIPFWKNFVMMSSAAIMAG